MAEYIERDALRKILRGSAVAKYPVSFYVGLFAAADEVEKMPAADVAPVVSGRWVMKETMIRSMFAKNAYCSECLAETAYAHNYCPNCGARMDGE